MSPERVKPRVLHILNTAARRGTGIAKIVRTIATRLRDRFEFSVWFIYEDGPLIEFMCTSRVDATYVPVMPGTRNPLGPLNLLITSSRQRFDLVHHHAADAKVRGLVKLGMRSPILLHLHARAVEREKPVPAVMSTRYADRVIAASEAVAQFTAGKAEVVYYGIDRCMPSVDLNKEGPIVVGTASRLIPLKGLDLLVRAFAIARSSNANLRLEIAGDGPARASLEDEVSRLRLTDSVKFLGWENDVRVAMRRWSIYAQPSLEEGLGISIVEAMTEGLPVIATNVGGIPEAVVDGETGWLVPPGDETMLAKRILGLAGDAGVRTRMAEKAIASAQRQFCPDKFVKTIASIYDQMLTLGGTGRYKI